MQQPFNRKLIRYIKKNFNFVEYLDKNGITYLDTNNPDELRICCPSCGEEDYKLYINTEKRTLCCFKCNLGYRGNGDLFNFIAEVEGVPVGVAIATVCADYAQTTPEGFALFEQEEAEEEEVTGSASFLNIKYLEGLPLGCVKVSEDDKKAAPFIEYLVSRGFSVEDILDLQTHYTKSFSKVVSSKGHQISLRDRVLWPVYGGDGRLVSWLSRTILSTPTKTKYINAPGSDLAKTFWPFLPLPPSAKTAIICEGLIDAFSIRKAGFPAYACFGKKLSEEQLALLKHWGAEEVIVFYDRDAWKETQKISQDLQLRFSHVFVVDLTKWPAGQDSGSLLTNPDGAKIIQDAVKTKINIKDELAIMKWIMENKA